MVGLFPVRRGQGRATRIAPSGFGLFILAAGWAFSLGFASPGRSQARGDFYSRLAGHWAPDIYQDTWFLPAADYLTAFDADGDWTGRNNLDNFMTGRFAPYRAVVYYTVMESETHYFIHYDFFHPVDYDRYLLRLLPGTCHENDLEGILVVLAKDPNAPWGRFRVMESLAHNFFYRYANADGISSAAGKSLEPATLRDGSHPQIYIQQGGHGPYELNSRKSGFKRGDFKGKTGVIYRFTGRAEAPEGPNDREVGYELVDFLAPGGIWEHRCGGETFDREKRMVYQPPPGRPGVPAEVSGCGAAPGTIPLSFDGDHSGLANSADRAKPFWSWAGSNTRGEPRGAWGLDPAWTMSRHYSFEEPFSLDYRCNYFLGIMTDCRGR